LYYSLLFGLTLLSSTLLSISFDDIEVWIGEGENQAGLIIDWEDEFAPTTLAWGYRWDGVKSGQEMLMEVMAAAPRFSGNGELPEFMTYDLNNDGTIDTNDHNANGDMSAGNFWAYYTSANGSDWNFATTNHAGRTLVDGEWDGWLFIADWTATPYPEIDAAIPAEGTIAEEELTIEELIVWAGTGTNEAMLVVDFNGGDEPQSYAWGFRWDGEADGTAMMIALSEIDPRLTIGIASGLLNEITLDIDNDGTVDYGIYEETDYWSTWSKPETGDWNWNSGCGTGLVNNARFGCSYGFTPESTQPDNPIAMPELPFVDTELPFEEILVWAGAGSNEAMLVVDFNAGDEPQSYALGYRWDGTADGTAMMTALSELDPRLTISLGSGFLTNIELDVDSDGTVDYGIYDDGDYWSTWSRGATVGWSWNNGCSTVLQNNGRFGCSYGFTPESTQPDNPIAMSLIPIVENEAPVAFNELSIVKNSGNNLLPILMNDEDADDNMDLESLVITTDANHGTVILNEDGTVTYSAESGYEGDDSFSYTVADELGEVSNIAICELTVVTPFSGSVGTGDCEAIAADSDEFVSWATGIELERGYMDISDESAGYVTYGIEDGALGEAEGTSMNVVSLGDGGNAILTFEEAICDEDGADFAIFENSFSSTFLELAFVEVSSDGENFFRFPATSYTQLFTQIADSNAILAEDINNLAGKYMQGYGTPFDLAELAGTEGLDIEQITHVKIIDAVGSINPDFASYDAHGIIVNEPWPTVSASGGFDLDGVGVIHQTPIVSVTEAPELVMELKNSYPNPFMPGSSRAGVKISLSILKPQTVSVKVFNIKGQQVATVCDRKFREGNNIVSWNGKDNHGDNASSGVYFYRMETNDFKQTKRLMIVK